MANPPMDLLTRRAFPELAAAIRARTDRILKEWETAVCQVLPTADELTFSQFCDGVPRLLAIFAEAFALEGSKPIDALIADSVDHGDTRYHQNYNLNELLIEYHFLRRTCIEQVSEEMGRAMTLQETQALNLAVDTAMRLGAVAFAKHQARQVQAATEAQSKYLSFLSHDLRGGLNGIFLMIEVLRRELSNHPQLGETVQDLELMRRSLMETVATMDRFLHAERFRKGKVQVKPAPVNLVHLLNELVAQVSYQAEDKGLDVSADVPASASMISDRELLTLIFQNLLSNAVKYTERGTVQISAKPMEKGWQVEVTDQGPGIAADKLAQLFDSFTRGDTHGQPGVGLGLSIAHQAATLLGAKLWAESVVGKGSTFFVQIPELAAKK